METPNHMLTRARAAEHVVHAIADARNDLLTPGVLQLLGEAVLAESDTVASWDFAGCTFTMSGACAVLGAAAVVTAPLEAPTLLFGGVAFAISHGLSALSGADAELIRLQHGRRFVGGSGSTARSSCGRSCRPRPCSGICSGAIPCSSSRSRPSAAR